MSLYRLLDISVVVADNTSLYCLLDTMSLFDGSKGLLNKERNLMKSCPDKVDANEKVSSNNASFPF